MKKIIWNEKKLIKKLKEIRKEEKKKYQFLNNHKYKLKFKNYFFKNKKYYLNKRENNKNYSNIFLFDGLGDFCMLI